MSLSTDAGTAVRPADASWLERLRASTLALDVGIVGAVSLVLGLVRLGAPALWFDEAYTWRQVHKGYIAQFEGYQPFYYWIEKPWTALAGTSEWALAVPVRRRGDARFGASRRARSQALRPADRPGERSPSCDEPVRRQVVAAGAGLPAPARREPRCDAAPASRARPALTRRLGGLRALVCVAARHARRRGSPALACSCSPGGSEARPSSSAWSPRCSGRRGRRRSLGRATRDAHGQRDERDRVDPVPVRRGRDARACWVSQV